MELSFFILVSLLLLLLGLSLFSFLAFRKKKYSNVQLVKAYKRLEDRNRKLTESISYAKRIQDSVLQPEALLRNHLPDSFVLFRPRDVLSGDFYWFSSSANKIFIAVADCSGHGVPGALMSMVAHTLLKEIINEKKVDEASKILTLMDERFSSSLHQQSGSMETVNEGMDISLCIIDKEKQTIEFAGASQSIYVVEKGRLTEVNGNNYSIGQSPLVKAKNFAQQTFSIKEGMAVYLFTDGFQDQFGGADLSRFLSARFMEILLRNSALTMNDQKQQLEKELNEWKAGNRQTDDVLVVGFKV